MADSAETQRMLRRIEDGHDSALEQLLARDRDLIRRMVGLRLGAEVQARLDPSDVVQEAQLQIPSRIHDYLRRKPMPYAAWVRRTTLETILRMRRQHVEAGCRSVHREQSMHATSSGDIARYLLDAEAGPEERLLREEEAQRLRIAIDQLPAEEQEVLLMRILEGLANQDVADAVGSDAATASRRFGRALLRLREKPGG